MEEIKKNAISEKKRIRDQKELEECTFKPQIYSKKKYKPKISFRERQEKFVEMKNLKLEGRKLEVEMKEYKNCSFEQNLGGGGFGGDRNFDPAFYKNQIEW